MMTAWFGVPGSARGRRTVHFTANDGQRERPICGARVPDDSQPQWCAHRWLVAYCECKSCLRIAASQQPAPTGDAQ